VHPAQIVLIGQLQDVCFVFLKILIGRGDAQIADDGGGMDDCFSWSLFEYSIKT
jgi:hypothetical protein